MPWAQPKRDDRQIRTNIGIVLSYVVISTFFSHSVAQQTSPPPPTPSSNTVLNPGVFVQPPNRPDQVQAADDFKTDETFSAAYVAADVNQVIHDMLGDFLGIDYSVAPEVSGVVTLRVDNLNSRQATIDTLRSALRALGIVVVDRGDMIAIARGNGQDIPTRAAALRPGEQSPPGGGVIVLSPKYLAPSQLAPLLTPYAPASTIVLTDDGRRFLLLRGDEAAINAISTAAAMYDVDWFQQISTSIIALAHVSPAELITELRPLLGPLTSDLELVPVQRLGKLIVLSRNPETMRAVQSWVGHLDQPKTKISPGVLLYHAKNTGADILAASLIQNNQSAAAGSLPPLGLDPEGGFAMPGAPSPLLSQQSGSRPDRDLSVSYNLSQNIIIARGPPERLAEAELILETLDQVTPQVLIEAAVIEVTLNDELQFGVNWRGIEDRLTATFSDLPNGLVASQFPGLSLSYVNTDIAAAINLLATVTQVDVVSRPSVVALNNETARLQVGDQVPIVTQSAVSVLDPDAPIVNQTVYRDTGVILSVIPRVRGNASVELEIAQEVSHVARTTSSGIDSPTIQQRRVATKLVVPSGGSVAIGGLISTTRSEAVLGVPLLKDIPSIGQLFRSNSDLNERTELVILITPRILRNDQESLEATAALKQSFENLKRALSPHG